MLIRGIVIAWPFRIPSLRTTVLALRWAGRFGRIGRFFLGAMRGVGFRSRPLLAALFRPTRCVQAPCASWMLRGQSVITPWPRRPPAAQGTLPPVTHAVWDLIRSSALFGLIYRPATI